MYNERRSLIHWLLEQHAGCSQKIIFGLAQFTLNRYTNKPALKKMLELLHTNHYIAKIKTFGMKDSLVHFFWKDQM